MLYLNAYLKKIIERGNIKLAESIKDSAETVGDRYLRKFSFTDHEIGLLLGNIQSGKTGQMFGIMCKAADLGFPVFLLLTTDNVVLRQQTLERVRSDLVGFCVCGENDTGLFAENNLIKPTIIVLKKNVRVLKLWSNVLSSTGFMKGNPLFVMDDEADAASLNTRVNSGQQSSINRYLDGIKNNASSSLYLQVTGTPQSIFLQTMKSGWHPYFIYYFHPGEGYLGGDFFFSESGKPECITFIKSLENPFRDVVIRHLAVSAQVIASGGQVCNCLIHPSVRITVHDSIACHVKQELNWCQENIETDFKGEFAKAYENILPSNCDREPIEQLFSIVKDLLNSPGKIKLLIMNGKNEVQSSDYSIGCNFIIGGNTLGRGVTFPSLQTIYYTRTSKKPQADTMWQHSRMFGYDRDPGLMKVYIDEKLYKIFSDINSTNNSIIAQIEKGINDIKIYYPDDLNPTRKNVLDNDHLVTISGGTNYYPFYPDNDSIEDLSALLKGFSGREKSYQVSLRVVKEILSHIIPSKDFNLKAFQAILSTILAENPTAQGMLIVRRNRDVAQGTGALLSPYDWQIGKSFKNKVVLTMYQVTGTKGWDGKPLWIPNIKLPDGAVYYDVTEE